MVDVDEEAVEAWMCGPGLSLGPDPLSELRVPGWGQDGSSRDTIARRWRLWGTVATARFRGTVGA